MKIRPFKWWSSCQ